MIFILAIFASYRFARDLAFESGPFGLYAKYQEFVERKDHKGWFWEGLTCPMCLSFWFALFLTIPLAPANVGEFIIFWFGIAGGAAFLIKLTG